MTRPTVEARVADAFPQAIAKHTMTVLLDQHVHRHLVCSEPGTWVHGFTITTWPGELCISGDMGTFVFRRLPDMFAFFRNDAGRVNIDYWHEKVLASDRAVGTQKYSAEEFVERVTKDLEEWLVEHEIDEETKQAARLDFKWDVLSRADDGEAEARQAARDFQISGEQVFVDFWEVSLSEYSYQFAWCCHAIVWAIQQWDARTDSVGHTKAVA